MQSAFTTTVQCAQNVRPVTDAQVKAGVGSPTPIAAELLQFISGGAGGGGKVVTPSAPHNGW